MPDDDAAALAADLRIALGQIMRRLRAEHGFPLAQGSVLGSLDRLGPQSISDLAVGARVRPPSMAQTVHELEAAALVERRPDPDDRRRAFVSLTPAGVERLRADRAHREGWLARVIADELSAQERALLRDVAPVLRHIGEA
jgi:DNA-binding MarR family transcriptional regulator